MEYVMLRRFLINIIFFVCLVYPGQAQDTKTPHPDVTVRTRAANSKTRLDIRIKGGKRYVILAKRDSNVLSSDDAQRVKVVGYIKDTAVILQDTYRSKPNGTYYCQAGEEQFLRIISVKGARPVETLRLKTNSCYDSVELDMEEGDEGIEWIPESSTMRVHLIGVGVPGRSEPGRLRTIRIDSEGRPIEQ